MIISDYIADFLAEHNIKDVFFIDGSACASMIVAVANNKKLKYYCPLHEQAGAFAVDGYYKAAGRMSAMIATSGPAGQNLINGIAASWYDSIPAFYLTGQINSQFLKPAAAVRQHGFQEHDIVAMVKTVTKHAVMVMRPKDIRYELEKALHLATTGRPGPVLIDVPMDIQKADVLPDSLQCYIPEISAGGNLAPILPKCADMIKKAQRPAFLIGGGVWLAGANKQVTRLIEKTGIPFFVTWNMIDFCHDDHPFYGGRVGTFGGDGRNFGIQNCDLLIAVGSRVSGRITGGMISSFTRSAKRIIVDIDENELRYQQVKGDLNICCDAGHFAAALHDFITGKNLSDFSSWTARVKEWKNKYPVVRKEYWNQQGSVNPYVFMQVLSGLMQDGDILVHEAGGNCVITSQSIKTKNNQRIFSNNGNSSLGYALPAAIGACVATGKPVICITGDGGLNFNIQELQTVKHYRLPIKIMVFNNYAFGITKLYRDTNFNSNYAGVDAQHGMSSPDFIKIAGAYGIKAVKINDHHDLAPRLQEVCSSREPVLCDINMRGFYDYKPRLGWSSPIEDQYPFLPRSEFRENMLIDPVEGWEDPVYPGRVKK